MKLIHAIICALSLLAANFLVEYFKDANYSDAGLVSWHQFVAIMIYYFIWIRPEAKEYEIL